LLFFFGAFSFSVPAGGYYLSYYYKGGRVGIGYGFWLLAVLLCFRTNFLGVPDRLFCISSRITVLQVAANPYVAVFYPRKLRMEPPTG
jgi:fucose permease